MIVCLCHRISERDIRRAVAHGERDFESLQEDTGLARNCGCCHDCARDVFDEACTNATKPLTFVPARNPILDPSPA